MTMTPGVEFDVLDLALEEAGGAGGDAGDPQAPAARPEEVRVHLQLGAAGEPRTGLRVPLEEEALAALLEVAFSVGGSREVDRVVGEVRAAVEALDRPVSTGPHRTPRPSLFLPHLPSALPQLPTNPARGRREEALELMLRHRDDQRERVTDAMADVDEAARTVLLELIRDSQIRTSLRRSGMREDVVARVAEVGVFGPTVIDGDEGAARFRRLRLAVLELDGLVRGVHAAEAAGAGIGGPRAATMASRLEPTEELARARAAYLEAWRRHVEEFPVLAVRGGAILADTTGTDPADLHEEPFGDYTDRLSWIVRREVSGVAQTARREGAAFVRGYLERATAAREAAAGWLEVGTASPGLGDGVGADVVHGQHNPFWRHPMIVRAALERIGAGPETLEYQAAHAALAVAGEVAAREKERAQSWSGLLDGALIGFGVLSMMPVVGTAAVVVSGVIAAARSLAAISSYTEERTRRMVFGMHADALDVPDPDGYGTVLAVVGNAVDVLGVLGPVGKAAGRYLRVTATARSLVVTGRFAGPVLIAAQAGAQTALETEIERRRAVFERAR